MDENLIERKKRLEKELDSKVSNDYREFINKSNDFLQQSRENTKKYYQDLLSRELDSMENAIKSGSTLQAMSHRLTANVYESILQNTQYVIFYNYKVTDSKFVRLIMNQYNTFRSYFKNNTHLYLILLYQDK